MDKKLEQWIAEQKAIQAKKRDEHLIEVGLFDDAKSYKNITYCTIDGRVLNTEEEIKRHKENGLSVETKIEEHYEPIQVSDEEYELICRYVPEGNNSAVSNEPTEKDYLMKIARSTKTVSTILVIYVILSVIVGIILAFTL